MKAFFEWLKSLFAKPVKVEPLPKVNEAKREPPRHYKEAKKYEGKKETDSKFAAIMIPLWLKLFGMRLGTIATDWSAWCGLGMGAALMWAGLSWQPDGALARNWGKYGVAIEWKTQGIPQGAIVWVNHKFDCSASSSNHVAQADGDCAAEDYMETVKGSDGVYRVTGKLKKGATINLYGANQQNSWKVSTYPMAEICAVRWPKELALPPKITKSINCTSGKSTGGSTR